jgi:hypothetical protein
MKYIKENLEPILIGFVIAIMTIYLFNTISDIIIKIALIKN